MSGDRKQPGFSLIETMLAVSTLAIGMVFVAGTFLAGVYFATVSAERTVATVVTDEALAKVVLYGLDPNDPNLSTDAFTSYERIKAIPAQEYLYPSVTDAATGSYSWAVLCRRAASESRLVELTVFVSRRTGANARYWVRREGSAWPQLEQTELPHPVRVNVVQTTSTADDELTIKDAVTSDGIDENTFLDDGSTIVDDRSGQIYRVLKRYAATPNVVKLDRPWAGETLTTTAGGWVWVVPRPVSGGRNPLVTVFQKVIRF
jgi:Tfp pilus assembly protein PilV